MENGSVLMTVLLSRERAGSRTWTGAVFEMPGACDVPAFES
jgi:hypothetical protein